MSRVAHASVEVFADYHQFYVQDGGISPPAPENWTADDMASRVKVAECVVVVCPFRDSRVPVELELHDAKPAQSTEEWHHVVHCSLALPTGHLQVHECTGGPVLDWHINPGQYELLVLFGGLATGSGNDLPEQDHYKVLLWPGRSAPLSVTRSWSAGG